MSRKGDLWKFYAGYEFMSLSAALGTASKLQMSIPNVSNKLIEVSPQTPRPETDSEPVDIPSAKNELVSRWLANDYEYHKGENDTAYTVEEFLPRNPMGRDRRLIMFQCELSGPEVLPEPPQTKRASSANGASTL